MVKTKMINPLYIVHKLKDREIKSSLDDRGNVIIYTENETQYHRLTNLILLYSKYTYLQLNPRNNNEYEGIYCFDRHFNFLGKYTIEHLISGKESNDTYKRLIDKFLKEDERFISKCIICGETDVQLTDVQGDSLCDNCYKEYLKVTYKPQYIILFNKIIKPFIKFGNKFNKWNEDFTKRFKLREKISLTFLCALEVMFLVMAARKIIYKL